MFENILIETIWAKIFWLSKCNQKSCICFENWARVFWWSKLSENIFIFRIWAKTFCWSKFDWKYFNGQNLIKKIAICRHWANIFWWSEIKRKYLNELKPSENILMVKNWEKILYFSEFSLTHDHHMSKIILMREFGQKNFDCQKLSKNICIFKILMKICDC